MIQTSNVRSRAVSMKILTDDQIWEIRQAAFDILEKISGRISGAADRVILDSPNDLLEPLLMPGAVARVGKRHYLLLNIHFPFISLEQVVER